MARFPLFHTMQEGRSKRSTAQRHINVYAEITPDGDRSQLTFYGRPGLDAFTEIVAGPPSRGMIAIENYLYTVNAGTFYRISLSGTTESKGTLNSDREKVCMTHNGREILIVDGTDFAYLYNLFTEEFTTLQPCDFLGDGIKAITCDFEGGFFLVSLVADPTSNIGQRFYKSGLYDGSSWNLLEFASAEGFPDNLVRIIVQESQVILFGEQSTEFWQNIGNGDFPYQRIRGGAVEFGLAARWSVADVRDTVMFLARNRSGEVQVVRLQGYQAVPVSSPDVDHLINQYDTVADATGIGYTVDGHSMYQINFPGAGTSWMYDNATNVWTELQAGAVGARHRAEIGVQFNGKITLSDWEDGNIYTQNTQTYSDNGTAFAKEVISRHMAMEQYLRISRIWADFEMGVGLATGQGSDPQAMLQVSQDNGHTYGAERWTSIGKIGEYVPRAIWRRLGRAYGWTVRIRVSDPVKFVLTGAWLEAS